MCCLPAVKSGCRRGFVFSVDFTSHVAFNNKKFEMHGIGPGIMMDFSERFYIMADSHISVAYIERDGYKAYEPGYAYSMKGGYRFGGVPGNRMFALNAGVGEARFNNNNEFVTVTASLQILDSAVFLSKNMYVGLGAGYFAAQKSGSTTVSLCAAR